MSSGMRLGRGANHITHADTAKLDDRVLSVRPARVGLATLFLYTIACCCPHFRSVVELFGSFTERTINDNHQNK